jgi:hypothetical protein
MKKMMAITIIFFSLFEKKKKTSLLPLSFLSSLFCYEKDDGSSHCLFFPWFVVNRTLKIIIIFFFPWFAMNRMMATMLFFFFLWFVTKRMTAIVPSFYFSLVCCEEDDGSSAIVFFPLGLLRRG